MYDYGMDKRRVRRATLGILLTAAVVSLGGVCELDDRDLGEPAMIRGPDQDEEFFFAPSRSPAADFAPDPGVFSPRPPPMAPNPPLPPVPGPLPPIVLF